jgi:hypothetical protein
MGFLPEVKDGTFYNRCYWRHVDGQFPGSLFPDRVAAS